MLSNVIDVDEAMLYAAAEDEEGMAFFFDFKAAFPSVAPDYLFEVLSAFVARQLASQSSPAQDDVIERILRCRGEWPGGLRAVALRLRDQPSSATTLRAVAALSGRSPLASSRLTRRGSASARRVGRRSSSRCLQSRAVGFRSAIPRTKIKTRLVTRGWSDTLNVQSINSRASPGVARRRATPGDARNDLIVGFVC